MEGVGVGRIVHYTAYNNVCLASIITGINPDKPGQVNLVVFTSLPNVNGNDSGGVQFHFHVNYSEEVKPGTWHWPERV